MRKVLALLIVSATLLVLALALTAIGCGSEAVTTTQATTPPTTAAETSTAAASQPATPMTNVTYYTKVTPAEAKELIDTTPDLVILDFGRAYDQGHLPGALDYCDIIVFGEGVPDSVLDTLDKNVPILIYEGTAGEGVLTASQLGSEGFTVYGLVGGLTAWIDAGYPVEK